MATAGHPDVSVLLREALATRCRQAEMGEQSAMLAHFAADAGGLCVERWDWSNRLVPRRGESVTVGRRLDQCHMHVQKKPAVQESGMGMTQEGVAMGAERAAALGVAEWMWEWMDWQVVQPREPCPGWLQLSMDFATGINRHRLQAGLRARLDAAEAAGNEAAHAFPHATGVAASSGCCRVRGRNCGHGYGGSGSGDGARAQ